MAKYAFNHEAEGLHNGLRIKEPRFDEIIKLAKVAFFVEDDILYSFESLLNNGQPANMVEAAAMGYVLGMIRAQQSAMNSNPIATILRGMRGEE